MIGITFILIIPFICVATSESCPSSIPTIEVSGSNNYCPNVCPDNFDLYERYGFVCLGVLAEATFDKSLCPYEDYEKVRVCRLDEPHWYPAKRNLDYGIGEFMSTYYTSREPVEIDGYEDNIVESNCVIRKNRQKLAVSCNRRFRRICSYKLLTKKMASDRCREINSDCLSVSYNSSELFCWCPKVSPEQCETSGCKGFKNYCKSILNYNSPKLSLKLEATTNIYKYLIELTTTSFAKIDSILVTCYSDCFVHKLFGIYQEFMYWEELILTFSETGVYWCSGFDKKYYNEIVSNKVTIILNNLYVIEVTFTYQATENPTSGEIAYTKFIQRVEHEYNYQHYIQARTLINIKTKWMKTLWVDEKEKKVTYLVHICTNLDFVQHLDEYYQINRTLYGILPLIEGFSNASELYSYEYCLKSSININGSILTWGTTRRNEQNTSLETYNDNYVTRKCIEDFYNGARWENINSSDNTNNTNNITTNITEELNNLLNSTNTGEIIETLFNITQNTSGFTPNDMFLISSILLKLNPNECDVENISGILSNLMISDVETLQKSQNELNATDRILDSYDRILETQKHNHSNKIITSTYLYTYIFNGTSENVGFGIIKSENYEAILINRSTSVEDIANISNLEAATYIPNEIFDSLDQDSKITITIHLISSLFNGEEKTEITGKNFGILLPKNITRHYEIPILFKPSNKSPNKCGFWNYGYGLKGSWKIENKAKILPNDLQVCSFPHVTHFGLLVLNDLKLNDEYLELITNIGSAISLFGFFGIFLTAALFKTWRQNRGNQILINYSIVSLVQFILLYSSSAIQKISKLPLCVAIGASLHYTLLSQFCWMLVIAFLQYKRYVQVLHVRQRWILTKAYLTSYIFPAIPVIILLVAFEDNEMESKVGLCFPSGDGLHYCVLLPIALVVLTNFLIFGRIGLEMFCIRKNKCIDDDMFLLRLRLVILMYFMLGITWCFGLAANILDSKISFYIFCITGSLQGFVIFLFFVVFNENSRLMYIYMWKKYSC